MDLSQLSICTTQTQYATMIHSQDEFLVTPRENNILETPLFNQVVSPMKKKRGRFGFHGGALNTSSSNLTQFSQIGSSQMSQLSKQNSFGEFRLLVPMDKSREDLFLSQDNDVQFSQDFTDRFGQQLNMKCNEDSMPDHLSQQSFIGNGSSKAFLTNKNMKSNTLSHSTDSNASVSVCGSNDLDGFPKPGTFNPFPKHRSVNPNNTQTIPSGQISNQNNNSQTTQMVNSNRTTPTNGIDPKILNKENAPKNANTLKNGNEKERQITLPPPIQNPFLSLDKRPTTKPHSTSIWITSFKERPRYITDFHYEGILGQGTSSVVHLARRRLDGVLYAVKILKNQIYSEGDYKVLMKEVCAHSALQGCPQVVQYFSCWIDDGQLHIQTEHCSLGNLDCLIDNTRNSAGRITTTVSKVTFREGDLSHMSSEVPLDSNSSFLLSNFQSAKKETTRRSFGRSESYISLEDELIDQISNEDCQSGKSLCSNSTMGLDIDNQNNDNELQLGMNVTTSSKTSPIPPLPPAQDKDTINSTPRKIHNENGSIDVIELAIWVILNRIGSALHYMHQRGMAHLDIRPANIFLASNKCEEYDPSLNSPLLNMNPNSKSAMKSKSNSKPLGTNSTLTNNNTIANTASNGLLGNIHSSSAKHPALSPLEVANMIIKNECLVKLGDFGLVAPLNYQGEIEEGESRYCAREVINSNGPIDLRCADIFSLGASAYELSLGRRLGAGGDDGSAEWHNIRDGVLESGFLKNGRYSQQLIEIITNMVDPEPSKRPTALEVALAANKILASHHIL